MLEFLRGNASDRKLRLFAVACCRRIWHLLFDERSRHAVEVGERHADGLSNRQERRAAALTSHKAALEGSDGIPGALPQWAWAAQLVTSTNMSQVSPGLQGTVVRGVVRSALVWDGTGTHVAQQGQAQLLRDLIGNPFRPVTIDPAWHTPTVTNLAATAYEERPMPSGEHDPARLAVLADALEEAVCDNADLLSHLRAPGPHVRGCWAVDLLLGKE
jgi:hypothetical protein